MSPSSVMTYFAGPIVLNEREDAAIGLIVLAVTLLPLYLIGLFIGFRIRRKLVFTKFTKLGLYTCYTIHSSVRWPDGTLRESGGI